MVIDPQLPLQPAPDEDGPQLLLDVVPFPDVVSHLSPNPVAIRGLARTIAVSMAPILDSMSFFIFIIVSSCWIIVFLIAVPI